MRLEAYLYRQNDFLDRARKVRELTATTGRANWRILSTLPNSLAVIRRSWLFQSILE